MDLPDDFRDMLICLADAGADFVVVGGHAVAAHGYVRATKDLDVFVRPTTENARAVYRALVAFGAPVAAFDVKPEDFETYDGVLQIGVAPLRVDILVRIAGVTFDDAASDPVVVEVEGRRVSIIGRQALVRNKRAAGRPQDLADVAILEGQSAR